VHLTILICDLPCITEDQGFQSGPVPGTFTRHDHTYITGDYTKLCLNIICNRSFFYFEMMSALFLSEFYTRMNRYWGENISIYRMRKLLFICDLPCITEDQGFQSGPVPGTFTRLGSCIVPAEITEPPKISGSQNHKYVLSEFYTRMNRYWGENISIYRMRKLLFTILR
jgi:hypothetical protein